MTALDYQNWDMADLVPHGEPMILLDKITRAETGVLTATANIGKSSPFFESGDSLAAWWSIEYMAQGVAAYAGLQDRLAGRDVPIGFLTSCRRFVCSESCITIGVTAEINLQELVSVEGGLAVFRCSFRAGEFVSEASISVYTKGGQ